jgi:plasmid stability protein
MASLTIRNLDETLKAGLRLQAAQHGWSMEQEVREILRQSITPAVSDIGFAQRVHLRFARYELDGLSIPERQTARIPDMTEE